jgi:hypothetical protein
VVNADEKLTAFLELERVVCIHLIERTVLTNNRSDSCEAGYVVRADEKLRAFLELEAAVRSGFLRGDVRETAKDFSASSKIVDIRLPSGSEKLNSNQRPRSAT